jgi:hypothetical protein
MRRGEQKVFTTPARAQFADPRAGATREITVHLHRPASFQAGNPVLDG